MLLRIYIGFSVACFLMLLIISWAVSCELKDRYGTNKIKEKSFPEKILGWLFTVVVCIIPIWHIFMAFILIFRYNYIVEGTIEEIKDNLDVHEEGD